MQDLKVTVFQILFVFTGIIILGSLSNTDLLPEIFAEDEDRKQDKINNKNNNNQLLGIGNEEFFKYFNQGLELDSQGRYEEAIVYYDKALELDPQDRNSLVYKGLALFYLGKYEEALSWYDKVLEILPYDSYVLDDKGTVLLSMGNYHEAITLFDKALEIDPTNSEALLYKGVALDTLGKSEEAITWYDKVLAIDPNDVDALYNKGVALDTLGKSEEAITWYDKVLAIDPKYIDALHNKGVALDTLGKSEEAITWYDKVLAIDPNDVYALLNKGAALYNLGQYQEAITLLDKALMIDPNHVDALATKGTILANMDDKKEAIVLFDKALEIDPNNEYAKNLKAITLGTKEETDSAISLVQISNATNGIDQISSTMTNRTLNTFKDSKTGISFQYPSDWQIASDEYVKSVYGESVEVIVFILPKSLDGSSLSILYEVLPFSMSADEYLEIAKKTLLDEKISMSTIIPVSIGSLTGYQYNFTDGFYTQTQILFVNDSKAFIMTYNLGETDKSKDLADIKSILDSFNIEKTTGDIQIDNSLALSDKGIDNVKGFLTHFFNSLFPETGKKFTNTDYGVDITFPKNWTGFEMKIIFPMAVVSPEGFNVTDIFTTITVDIIGNITSDYMNGLSKQKEQELAESLTNKLMEYTGNKTPTMSVIINDKEFVQLMNSLQPNSTISLDSLTSIYERLASFDSTISCDRKTLNHVTLHNNISAEMSTEQCLFTASNQKQDGLNYLILTPNAMIGIHYLSNLNKENDRFLPEFEEALKSLVIEESLPINNQTIKQFLNG